ncbi:MAG: cupin domain-containing protein [Alphaproteobacteria bacterium]|nr:cupin domain-containing protein [Alphaproteobacteria bacterium]MBU1514646.1 cupin domain-containing protein [Alphaproteobacteria bacterium]MBU2096722.1 cupin domain-containing protein [Alphaproteobacteria bacterium]MBU2150354.1 cupin domain-containing protein [Alphaproteobacteria bacterium]MBU2306645.1 cupin domain-containing protein [Alphaproteobacteria bacterium]
MPKIDIEAVEDRSGSNYPHPFREICLGPTWKKLGDAAGLTDFGVNLVRLTPGKWSSQRHWHTHEDEIVYVLEGEVVLVEDDGEHVLRAGDCAGWKAGSANGHCLQNHGDRDAVYLEIGSRRPEVDACDYPDLDMVARPAEPFYRHRDGTPYPED